MSEENAPRFTISWSKEEVREFAIKNNYSTLFACINVYERDINCSWEQSMQACAILLSEQLREAHNEILRLNFEITREPIFTRNLK